MWVGDRISYINVYFAFAYHNWQGDHKHLKLEAVKEFCYKLVQDNVNHPEPYFFFLVLFWPHMILQKQGPWQKSKSHHCLRYEHVDPDILDLLKRSIARLAEFEDQLTDAHVKAGLYIHGKPVPIFYLSGGGTKERDNEVPIISSKNVRWGQIPPDDRVHGKLDDKKDVVVSFAGDRRSSGPGVGGCREQSLTIRAATLYTRGKHWVKTVSFILGFTFSGPVAYGISPDDVESRNVQMASRPVGNGEEEK